MNTAQHPDAKIEALRIAAQVAIEAHDTKDAEMKAAGANSKVRYPALAALREAKNATYAAYKTAADGYIHSELNKMIRANRKAGVTKQESSKAFNAWCAKY
jgi:hypothetical protein